MRADLRARERDLRLLAAEAQKRYIHARQELLTVRLQIITKRRKASK